LNHGTWYNPSHLLLSLPQNLSRPVIFTAAKTRGLTFWATLVARGTEKHIGNSIVINMVRPKRIFGHKYVACGNADLHVVIDVLQGRITSTVGVEIQPIRSSKQVSNHLQGYTVLLTARFIVPLLTLLTHCRKIRTLSRFKCQPPAAFQPVGHSTHKWLWLIERHMQQTLCLST
jgi:hypothetical protein